MPTVVRSRTTPLFSFRRQRMAPRVADIRLAERKDTMVHTCCTARQSSSEGSTPSLVRISIHFFSPSLVLKWQVLYIKKVSTLLLKNSAKTILFLHVSLFNCRYMFRLNLSSRQELGGYSSLKQQPLFGHLDQDESYQFSHVHATGHLFKSNQKETQQCFHTRYHSYNFYSSKL